MVTNDETICPHCGGELKYYDRVKRIVRTKIQQLIKRYFAW